MADPPMIDDSTAVTRRQLRDELLRFVPRQEVLEEIERFGSEWRGELLEEIRRHPIRPHIAEEFARFRAEFEIDIKTERTVDIAHALAFVAERMEEMEKRLTIEIARAARAGAEEHRREVGVIDEKYRDLPGRVAVLERDLDAHRGDRSLHVRPKPRRPRS
jgi:hypothetical protein